MSLFSGEKPVVNHIRVIRPAAVTGELAPNGIGLTAGDVVLFTLIGSDAAEHVVVLTSGNAIAVRS